MVDTHFVYRKLISLLDNNDVEYKLFSHKEALTWEELKNVQRETGFVGTEMKCLVLKAGEKFIVYITIQGNRVNFDAIKKNLDVSKVKLSTPEELREFFGAQPGCAYPFGFDDIYPVYLDPEIYQQDWLLFSPVVPTQTVQAKGSDIRKVFMSLKNPVHEVTNFNLTK
jgi:Ala-tRNA(Pro) deacylase